MSAFTSVAISLNSPAVGFDRAEIVFEGVEQGGPSFEGRVFVNNATADQSTERTLANGYAGAFHVYGYGSRRLGSTAPDVGTDRPDVALPITKYLVATEIVRDALESSNELTVSVVPSPPVPGLHFDRIAIVFDRAT